MVRANRDEHSGRAPAGGLGAARGDIHQVTEGEGRRNQQRRATREGGRRARSDETNAVAPRCWFPSPVALRCSSRRSSLSVPLTRRPSLFVPSLLAVGSPHPSPFAVRPVAPRCRFPSPVALRCSSRRSSLSVPLTRRSSLFLPCPPVLKHLHRLGVIASADRELDRVRAGHW